MALNREGFLRRKSSTAIQSVELPGGQKVLLRSCTAKLYRDYKRSLRDKDGAPIPEKQAFGDELLIAALMVDSAGLPIISAEEVLAGALDDHSMADLTPIIRKAYEVVGFAEADEDREGNSSRTASTEQS